MTDAQPSASRPARLWPLYVSVFLVMAANGMQGTLLGLRATAAGFSGLTTGVVMACYFTGFLVGAPVTARLIVRLGHVRTSVLLASLAATTAPLHGAWVAPLPWGGLRLVYGFAMAGFYVVWENWLNSIASNANRGRLLSRYMLAMMTGFAGGPLLVALGEPTTYAMFLVPALVMAASVVPVWAAGGAAPAPADGARRASLVELVRRAPTGMVGGFLIGIAHGGLVGMGAVYGKRIGLSKGHVALLLSLAYLGAVVFQVPLGWLYDHRSRRGVLVGACAVVAVATVASATVVPMDGAAGLVAMVVVGGLVFPLYGLANAYTNHQVPDELRAAASGGFVQLTGVGAVVGPVATALTMNAAGAGGYFWTMAAVHVVLGAFVVAWSRVGERTVPALVAAEPTAG